ncbi:hypothetical protein Hanom_Chr04g00370371 [Helianthus anomalus]
MVKKLESYIVIHPRGSLCEHACMMWSSIYNCTYEKELYLPTTLGNMNISCLMMTWQCFSVIEELLFSSPQQQLFSPSLHLVLVLVPPAIT